MQSSLKVYYFVIFFSLSFLKVVSYSEDYHIHGYAEDNAMEKQDNPEFYTTSGAFSNAMEPEKVDKEDHVPDDYENDTSYKKFNNSKNGNIEYGALKEKCPYYKHGVEINDLDKISDVWQVVYYKLDEDITCFKMYIRKIVKEEKSTYYERYGSFVGKVNWQECDLEIRTDQKSETLRRHFLQRGNLGVMDNVIISEQNVPWKLQKDQRRSKDKEDSTYTLHHENPDQWLVVNNLLLMRDCKDGDVVVFSRLPNKPRRKEIMDALVMFGEYTIDGKLCKEIGKYKGK